MRPEEELWKKYEAQRKICGTDEEEGKNPFNNLITSKLQKIGLAILEWALGLKGKKPTEKELYEEYTKEIKDHPRPRKGIMRGLPAQERSVKTAWLGWVLGIPDEEIMKHQKQYALK